MVRFATAGSFSAQCERDASAVMPCSSQGTPSEGKSVGNRFFTLPRVLFIEALAASTWARRCAGSAICVPRLMSVIDAWLFAAVSPFARNETGTAATRDLRGSGPCS